MVRQSIFYIQHYAHSNFLFSKSQISNSSTKSQPHEFVFVFFLIYFFIIQKQFHIFRDQLRCSEVIDSLAKYRCTYEYINVQNTSDFEEKNCLAQNACEDCSCVTWWGRKVHRTDSRLHTIEQNRVYAYYMPWSFKNLFSYEFCDDVRITINTKTPK